MPIFEVRRYEQILAQMLASIATRAGMVDITDTSVTKHILAASARQDSEQWYQMFLVLQLFSIDTASGKDLDERAKEIQPGVVTREGAHKATGTVVFSRSGTTGTTVIPAGTRVKTSAGVIFSTLAAGEITPTSGELISGHGVGRDSGYVAIEADTAGTTGNVAVNTITRFVSKPNGVDSVTNTAGTALGADQESDDSFRRRLKAYVTSLARCQPSAIEFGLVGQRDPVSGKTILYAKLQEDVVNRGFSIVYIDDGTGSAEAVADYATPIAAVLTWNGTTTITTPDTSEVVAGDWIRLDADGQWFEITSLVPNTSITILNPGADTIPTGATSSSIALDIVTEGLSPTDEAVGGETRLFLDNIAIKDVLPVRLASDVNGNLTAGVDYTLDPTRGQVIFTMPLVAGEKIVAGYIRYTGLIEFAQRVIDGDPNDRQTYPGYRAAGCMVRVQTPQILIQPVTLTITVAEGYDHADVRTEVIAAAVNYINTLPVSGDLIRARLISALISVAGVLNVDLITPADDVILLDDQITRTSSSNITVL
jgi:uncharacterized phage protein gp47/JayE